MEQLISVGVVFAYVFVGLFLSIFGLFACISLFKLIAVTFNANRLNTRLTKISDNVKNVILKIVGSYSNILKLLLISVISFFIIVIYLVIMKPINFNKEKETRFVEVINRLKDIREIQIVFKSKYGKYCDSFDTLINFYKTDSILLIQKKHLSQDTSDNISESEIIDSAYISVISKIKNEDRMSQNFNIDSLKFIPFSGGQVFYLATGEVNISSDLKISVFEANAENYLILKGMDKQQIVNLNEEMSTKNGFPGLRVGSLSEANNNSGNWE